MMDSKKKTRVPKAVEGIRTLRERLADTVPAYAEAAEFEDAAEAFCRHVRQQLRARRKQSHLDQATLGARIGMTQSAVSKLEGSDGDIGLKSVFRYAKALGLRPTVVFMPSADVLVRGDVGARIGEEEAVHAVEVEQDRILRDVSESVAELLARFVAIDEQARDG